MNRLIRSAIISCLAVFLGASCNSVNATLIGDYVFGHMQYDYDPNMGNLFEPGAKPGCPECIVPDPFESSSLQPFAVVLDPDLFFPEFIFRHEGLHEVIVDIDEASIDLVLSNISGGPAVVAPHEFEIRLTDITWVEDGVPGIITSASIVDESLFPGLSVSVINEGTGLLLDFSNSPPELLSTYNSHSDLWATIVFETALITPEPTTCLLAAFGLSAVLCMRKR